MRDSSNSGGSLERVLLLILEVAEAWKEYRNSLDIVVSASIDR